MSPNLTAKWVMKRRNEQGPGGAARAKRKSANWGKHARPKGHPDPRSEAVSVQESEPALLPELPIWGE